MTKCILRRAQHQRYVYTGCQLLYDSQIKKSNTEDAIAINLLTLGRKLLKFDIKILVTTMINAKVMIS